MSSNDEIGVARGTVFQEVRPGAGFKTGEFSFKEKLADVRYEESAPLFLLNTTPQLGSLKPVLIPKN